MAFGMFRKRPPESAAPAIAPPPAPAVVADASGASDNDSAGQILELLEVELGALIRQLERAANSVAGGAEATATTLSTIRQRTDALTGRSSAAQSTATTFSHAADKFTQSADGIGAQVRDAGVSVQCAMKRYDWTRRTATERDVPPAPAPRSRWASSTIAGDRGCVSVNHASRFACSFR